MTRRDELINDLHDVMALFDPDEWVDMAEHLIERGYRRSVTVSEAYNAAREARDAFENGLPVHVAGVVATALELELIDDARQP